MKLRASLLLFLLVIGQAPPAVSCGLSWAPSITDALAGAKASERLAVVVFTGSDWSPLSFKLDQDVLMNPEFADVFERHFALTNADFPQRTPLAPETLAENTSAATRFGIKEWPTLVALRPDGTEFARIAYAGQSAQEMLGIVQDWAGRYNSEIKAANAAKQ